MTPRRSDAADRILREAMRLFAEKGYERTSVPEIQAAAGLTRGSGAMYKHYASKEALLRAIIDGLVATSQATKSTIHDTDSTAGDALRSMAQHALRTADRARGEIRIIWRDLDQFPSLQAKVRREVMQSTYLTLASWLQERARKGELRQHDSVAVAAVILGSLVQFKVFEAIWGEKTAPVNDERFVAAWCDVVMRGLQPGTADSAQRWAPKPRRLKKAPSVRAKPAVGRSGRKRETR